MTNFLLLGSLFLTFNLFASTTIEEEVYIRDTKSLSLIEQHPELVVDHLNSQGFELYGPKGTKKWLDQVGIAYEVAESHGHDKNNEEMSGYPSYEDITHSLKTIVAKYPHIMKLESIGKSVQGRELWMVKISDNVETDELEPEFKFISSMHGDEIVGRELMVSLLAEIGQNYGKDQELTDLVDNTEIYIMPSMNPDGSEKKSRSNANYKDLNRNFPDFILNSPNSTIGREPETVAIMNFQKNRNFALSANFHGGAVVVNYPWDTTKTRHPLDSLVKGLSLRYANLNPAMRNSREFKNGIINGADWYVVQGGMQDWSYFWHNDLQVTVELSDTKWPRYSEIPSFYKENRDGIVAYMKSIHQGAGFKLPNNFKTGTVQIWKKSWTGNAKSLGSYGFSKGEFYKVLEEGEYLFKVNIDGVTTPKTFETTVENKIYPNGNYKLL
jgi:hypothetical protein